MLLGYVVCRVSEWSNDTEMPRTSLFTMNFRSLAHYGVVVFIHTLLSYNISHLENKFTVIHTALGDDRPGTCQIES